LSHWRRLLDRAVNGLERLRHAGHPVPDWVLGGGTALVINAGHRISKDIDIFIYDAQYISFLSPRLAGEGTWGSDIYDEAPNHLKLIFPEGEIDFIVAAPITNLPAERKVIDMSTIRIGASHAIDVEHPVEIALKKLNYRGSMLKVRDIFDISVVDTLFPQLLRDNLSCVAHLRSKIIARLDSISETFLRLELGELDVSENWRKGAESCLPRVRKIIASVPEPEGNP
jgi:hypothetical protein